MAYTPVSVKELIKLGGNLKITSSYSPVTLKEFVSLAKARKVQITIQANSLTIVSLKELITIGQEYLTIEL